MINILSRKVIVPLLSVVLLGAGASAFAKDNEKNDAVKVNDAKVSLQEAVSSALLLVPGKAVKAEFSNDDDNAVWEIEILSADKQVHDIEINAINKKVMKNKMDKKDNEEKDDEEKQD